MHKRQLPRVKTLAALSQLRFLVTVDRVAENRMVAPCEMDADLVCSARFQLAAHMRIARIAGDDLPVCDGAAACLLYTSSQCAQTKASRFNHTDLIFQSVPF